MAAVAALLTVFSNDYGFHRDELYFRMLEPGWGYVDQGPLTPLLVRFFSEHVADEPWAIHLASTAASVVSLLVVVLITRELGGGRAAQTWCAWAYASATIPLIFGHIMITSSLDLVCWPLATLFIMRAVLRSDDRWWIAAAVVVGLSMYNKFLIAMLLVALAAGLALVGPRRVFRSPWVLGSAALALVIGAPNIIYQLVNSWPELEMGRALADHNAGEVRVQMWPFTAILFGPPVTVIWVAGLVAVWRRPDWRPVRFLAVALPVLLALVFLAGTQVYYPEGLLAVFVAAGAIPVSEFVSRSRPWRAVLGAFVGLNALVSATIALPLIPVSDLGSTPVPDINQAAQDSVGWPAYVRQVARVYANLTPAEQRRTAVIASNYGEAGAIARYGPGEGIPTVYSPHNELYYQSQPPASADIAVAVGGEIDTFRREFRTCTAEGRLDNLVDVDNEEQGLPIAVCRGPRASWPVIWAALQHYD
jgi:dolichyl-phosphate-mannose-protein mannosyltransferase